MYSRRSFLRHYVASSAGLAWAVRVRAEEKRDPLVTEAVQKAVKSGLAYLKENQHKDGSFGTNAYEGSVGITSLCGLALLSGGQRPGADKALDSALEFVISQEDPNLAGFLYNAQASPHGAMYNHGFAVLFLAKAVGHIEDKKRAEKPRGVLGRAVALTLKSQNREKGWRYHPTSQDSDLTVTTGQLIGLGAARAAGVNIPKAAVDGGVGYIQGCQDRASGGFRYMLQGAGPPNWSRTAAALLALYSAGVNRGPVVEPGLAYLMQHRPDPKAEAGTDIHFHFGHYHAALATWAAGGDVRKQWYTAARDQLVARQQADGSWKDPICAQYGTAMVLIALLAPNGYLSPKMGPS
jgi:hypothetical protein